MGFQRILVAVDQSPLATEVFSQALDLVSPDSRLMIFHCLSWKPIEREAPPMTGTLSGLELYGTELVNYPQLHQQRLEREMQQNQTWLQDYYQKAIDQGIAAEFENVVGDPGTEICDLAKKWQADLVVVGRRGHTGLEELFLGSVSNHVVHHAPCAVLVIQGVTPSLTSQSSV